MNYSIFLLFFFLRFTSGQQILQFTELLLAFCTSSSLSVLPPHSTPPPHPGVKEAQPACTSHWRKSFEHLQPRGSWGSSCVCYYPICMTILQLQVLPEDANKNRVPRHFAFESKLSPFPARRSCCKPTQSLDQSWWGRPHPSHAGIYKGFISVGIRYRIKWGRGGVLPPTQNDN